MVLHGAVSAELFVDCNGEGFFLLAKFAPILDAIREKNPAFMTKTSELVNRFSAAAQRYEVTLKRVEAIAQRTAGKMTTAHAAIPASQDEISCRNPLAESMIGTG